MNIENKIIDLDNADSQTLMFIKTKLMCPELSSRELGNLGERYVSKWLQALGWKILNHNWSTRFGELDIVALDHRRCLVFVEVKTRRTTRFGLPQEAVSNTKQHHLKQAASQWLTSHSGSNSIRHERTRFDVAAVLVNTKSPNPSVSIKFIEGAF